MTVTVNDNRPVRTALHSEIMALERELAVRDALIGRYR